MVRRDGVQRGMSPKLGQGLHRMVRMVGTGETEEERPTASLDADTYEVARSP